METYVLDASFLVSVLTGDGGRKPASLFDRLSKKVRSGDSELVAPQFVALEVANGLRFKIAAREETMAVYLRFRNLPLKLITMSLDQINELIQMAFDLGVTVYDASYHLLARELGGTLITCDRQYYSKAKKLGGIELI